MKRTTGMSDENIINCAIAIISTMPMMALSITHCSSYKFIAAAVQVWWIGAPKSVEFNHADFASLIGHLFDSMEKDR